MNLREFVIQAGLQPGASKAVSLTDHLDWANVLVDPRHSPAPAKFGQFKMAVLLQGEAEDGSPLWEPRTLYVSPKEGKSLVDLLPQEDDPSVDDRIVVTVVRHLTAATNKDGEQKVNKDGLPIFDRELRFVPYAKREKFADLAVPARVEVKAPLAAAAAAPKVASKPLPKPLV